MTKQHEFTLRPLCEQHESGRALSALSRIGRALPGADLLGAETGRAVSGRAKDGDDPTKGTPMAEDMPGPDNQLFKRLLEERIVFLGTEVSDESANAVCAQLLLLNAVDP